MNSKKNILITGSSGFLGSHIADALYNSGYNIVLFDKLPSPYKQSVHKEIVGDILNKDDINKAIKGCHLVYHIAAQADINTSSADPTQTMHVNIIGTQNILEAAKKHNIERVLFASTIYVYSELGSFYRVSKQACEKMIEEYQIEYGLNYTILRYGSLYGPRANKFNSILEFLTQALTHKKIIRRGDGQEIREYIHAKDAAQLSVQALEKIYINKHLIITGNQQTKVRDLLTMIQEIFQGDIKIEYANEEELHHYEITPYAYKPQVALKIVPEIHHDLGEGLLDLIFDLEVQFEKEKKPLKVSLRKRKNENS
jgi:UDP-glucose 4-epimerase